MLTCLSVLLSLSCNNHVIYQNKIALTDHTWPTDTLLTFFFQVKDTTQLYDIYLIISNTLDYPYQNLYITHYLEDTAQDLGNELKNYILFEAKTGKPFGQGWGKLRSHELIMVANHRFLHTGMYTLKLAQFMRTEALSGIRIIGIKVVYTSQTMAINHIKA